MALSDFRGPASHLGRPGNGAAPEAAASFDANDPWVANTNLLALRTMWKPLPFAKGNSRLLTPEWETNATPGCSAI